MPAVLREAALGYDMLVLGLGPGPSRELARQVLSQVAALGEAFGLPVDVSVEAAAHAAPAIVEAARRVGADLVLLGDSPRPTHRRFMGSTISYVVNHAPCAVAVIRP
ncbi:MAG: universal stress protein [Chthonomonadales bacterium]|nr:universal stress protein [Chthonomonadales bacterium]